MGFEVGDKEVGVGGCGELDFDDVVKGIFGGVWVFEGVGFEIVVWGRDMEGVFEGELVGDGGSGERVVGVGYGIGVVVYGVERNMEVGMVVVEMVGDEEVGIVDWDGLDILKGDGWDDRVGEG